MPVKSSTATASKRRARKTITSKSPVESKTKVIPVQSVTKYTEPLQNETMTETPAPVSPQPETTSTTRRFATTRPAEPKITLEEYVTDFKIRMQINNYEVMEFLADVVKFYKSAKPVVIQSIDYVKDSYDRAFNQEQDQKEEEKQESQDS